MITGKLYDYLKFLALVLLPALGTFYFALSGVWGLPGAEQVVGTIVVFDTFLGAILQISSNAYNKSDAKFDGSFIVEEEPGGGKKIVTLDLSNNPEALANKDQLTFKVDPSVAK